ncbi:MAG: hypothetical protein M3Z64_08225 [Verrucomicrobiota bacterium]|nr:hypothetical protein [Verrucomicrobiota bacterium]
MWRTILLVYRELDVKLPAGRRGRSHRFHHFASEAEVADALDSFRAFPGLVASMTDGAVRIAAEIVHVDHPLHSLTGESPARWWPSPNDTRRALDRLAPPGRFDSVFVSWPQRDFGTGSAVPCDAWGLAVGASAWSNGATYAAIANAPSAAWRGETPGEVWLHEWLHGVCHHFAGQGHAMPEGDADGAERHGYLRSPIRGWTDYYRDLMNGNVLENGRRLGIPIAAWREEKTLLA